MFCIGVYVGGLTCSCVQSVCAGFVRCLWLKAKSRGILLVTTWPSGLTLGSQCPNLGYSETCASLLSGFPSITHRGGGPLTSMFPFFWVHVLMLMKHITLEPPRKGAWGWLGKIWRHCIYENLLYSQI